MSWLRSLTAISIKDLRLEIFQSGNLISLALAAEYCRVRPRKKPGP
jgi:hypothetical protein